LTGQYFNNITLSGAAALQRTEAINFNWGTGAPGTGIGVDRFSTRWTGQVQAPLTGSYQFQTNSDDGVRVSLNGQQIVNNWTDHGPTINTSAAISLSAGIKYNITVEYYENTGGAVASLSWKLPGSTSFGIVPADRLFAGSAPVVGQFASTLVAKHSGQCLEVPGNSVTQGIALLQNICNGTNAQLFDFIPVAAVPEIYTLKNRNSGLCVDIENASLDNRAPLVQSACSGSTSQQYLLTANATVGANAFQVIPQHTGKCVDVSGALQTAGAKVQQWDCWSGTNQIWTIGGKP
jgi:PA14 domain/Ricin-type beta-trefoil lectin domain